MNNDLESLLDSIHELGCADRRPMGAIEHNC